MAVSLKRNIVSHAGAVFVGLVVQLSLVVVLSHLLEVQSFSVYLMVAALVGVFEIASDFGTRIWAMRQFSAAGAAPRSLLLALLGKGIFTLVFGLLVLLLPMRAEHTAYIVLGLLIAITQPSTDPLIWYLRGTERLDIESAFVLAWRLCNAVSMLVLAYSGVAVLYLFVSWFVLNVCRILAECIQPFARRLFAVRSANVRIISFEELTNLVRIAIPIGLASSGAALFQRLGVIALGRWATSSDVANFGAAFSLVSSSTFLAVSISVASFPRLTRAIDDHDYSRAREVLGRKVGLTLIAFLMVATGGMIVGPIIVRLLFSSSLHDAPRMLVLLMPGVVISAVNIAMKYLLNALHSNWWDALSVTCGVCTFLAVFWLFNATGAQAAAAVGWCFGELAVFVLRYLVVLRHRELRMRTLNIAMAVCIAAAGTVIMLALPYHRPPVWGVGGAA